MRFGLHAAVTLIILTTVTAAPAYAAVLGIHVTTDTVSAPGFVINTITVDTDTDLVAVGAYAQLISGTMNQLANPPFFPDPETALPGHDLGPTDSFVTINGEVGTSASISGGADVGGGDFPIFNSTGMDVAWYNIIKTDIGAGLPIGRFVFSDDTQGTWNMAVAAAGSPLFKCLNNSLVNGEMFINPLHGDLNFNDFVGIEDLNIILGNWDENIPPADPRSDPSEDGFVGIEDLKIVLSNWNNGTTPRPTVPVYMEMPGDANSDGYVGITDKVTPWWNMTVTPGDISQRDMSGDGFVGLDDMNIWLSNWDNGTPPMVVPEPGTAAFVGVVIGLFACRRRSR